ncbi:MAG: glycine--tRNA ligase subunit beta [Acidobacteriia bacterium]|nr:glycine--tRNA ligase subunit beta [Terriglobia bacterium]
MSDFLLEIGCEEIPARMLDAAREELAKRVSELLTRESLLKSTEAMQSFATPRRLAVLVPGVSASQPDVTEQVNGPSLKVAYKDGVATPAAEAFAKKVGVDVSKLEKVSTPKGDYLAATVTRKGRAAAEVLGEFLPKEIAGIYWAKNMYWRAGKPERFVRPVRWIVALLDGEVVPLEYAGIKAGNQTRGHRILSAGAQTIARAADYHDVLNGAKVLVSRAEREHKIRKALDAATRTVAGARWREDAPLLDTVVNLTEWPSCILGGFDPQFLSLPEEVLVTVMRDHQKYFAVEDSAGKLAPHFLAVLNTEGDPDGLIRHGNERVLRARFNDARFFWDTDQKTPLKHRVEMLKAVTFQKELGNYHAKSERVATLISKLAEWVKFDLVTAQEAARLAKTDLTTELVKEFTELQGVVGGLYAKAQGSTQAVADAIYDQYKPESMEDDAPRTLEGALLSIADKADTIAGMFGLGLAPSGSKDPFALRRQANGIIKTIADDRYKLRLRLNDLVDAAFQGYEGSEAAKSFKDAANAPTHTVEFLRERVQFYLKDHSGFTYDTVNAVLAIGFTDVVDAVKRCEAVGQIRASADFEPLFIAFKRIKNIIRQAREKGFEIASGGLKFEEKEEAALWQEFQKAGNSYLPLQRKQQYLEAFRELAKVRGPVDTYFDKIMVMVEDPALRARRLGVMNYLLETFSTIADLAEIVTATVET